MVMSKRAPARSAGCPIILKPAEQTPLATLLLDAFIQAAGIPEGVVNIVTDFGETAGAALVDHRAVDKITFTGSSATLKRMSLELGGKSPTIILADADPDRPIPGASRSLFMNSGQVCGAALGLYAHKTLFDGVVGGMADKALRLRAGPGLNPDTEIGPLMSEEQLSRVAGYLYSAHVNGAELVVGGHQLDGPGYFVESTILTNTTRDMSGRQEEIFGPVRCVMRLDDLDLSAIAADANGTVYGVAANIWTKDMAAGHTLARLIRAGPIRVNGGVMDAAIPFGGYKESGWGRENGREGVELYTELKSVSVRLG